MVPLVHSCPAARVSSAPTDSLTARPRRRWLALRPSLARDPKRVRAPVFLASPKGSQSSEGRKLQLQPSLEAKATLSQNQLHHFTTHLHDLFFKLFLYSSPLLQCFKTVSSPENQQTVSYNVSTSCLRPVLCFQNLVFNSTFLSFRV